MKRIVNGHYADPNSTRDIVEISPEEFEEIKFAFRHQHKKMQAMLKFADEDLHILIAEQMATATEHEMKSLQLLTPDVLRASFRMNIDLMEKLMNRMDNQEKEKNTSELKSLSFSDFAVLIDAVRFSCSDITSVINTDEAVLRDAVTIANIKSGNNLSPEKIEEGIDKVLGSGQEDLWKRSKILYGILEQINLPYEDAVYYDRDGNEADTSGYIKNKDKPPRTDIN